MVYNEEEGKYVSGIRKCLKMKVVVFNREQREEFFFLGGGGGYKYTPPTHGLDKCGALRLNLNSLSNG